MSAPETAAASPVMTIDVVSIFPDYLAPLNLSLVGKAVTAGVLGLGVHDLRTWTTDRHKTVDDTPAGGGAGMVMRPDVWGAALDQILEARGHDAAVSDLPGQASADDESVPPRTVLIVPTPSGPSFTQAIAHELAQADHLIFACGRYEGIDARVAAHYAGRGVEVRELSSGDYVLNGGEVATMVMVEAIARLLPGVIGNPESLVEESHGEAGLLEYPVFTKPPVWREHETPEVLLSGHHAKIARWRRDRSLEKTLDRRPDMIAALPADQLNKADYAFLAAHGWRRNPDGTVSPA